MRSLSQQRCFNHSRREAAARCPGCAHFYCRECITEHEDRVVCAACLKKLAKVPLTKRPAFVGFLRVIQCVAGILVAWFFFFVVAEGLLRLPASFHEGTIWRAPSFDQD